MACAALAASAAAPAIALDRTALLADPPDRIVASQKSLGSGDWVLAVTPGPDAASVADASQLQPIDREAGLWLAPRDRAVAAAARLRRQGFLRFSEPDTPIVGQALPPGGAPSWLSTLTAGLTPPPGPVGAQVAVIDTGVDTGHPALAGLVEKRGGGPFTDHGTAVTSVVTSQGNPQTGFWPGVRVVSFGVDRCSSATAAVLSAAARRIPVINMSYGFRGGACLSHTIATQRAVAAGSVLVAAAGNEFESGNPRLYPAYDPHVLTVVALTRQGTAAPFSEANARVDLGALGVDVPVAKRGGGFESASGTSFAAPAVAAATAWVSAARPELSSSQIFDVMRRSARDLGEPGWDRRFGFGELDLNRALSTPAPRVDPREPNDDVGWLDGTHLPAKKPLLRTGSRATILARLDREEDPVDVTAVWIPPRRAARIDARSLVGDVQLRAYPVGTTTVRGARAPEPLATARARSGQSASLSLINPSGRARVVYLSVSMPDGAPRLDALYRLTARRVKTSARSASGLVRGPAGGIRSLVATRKGGRLTCTARTTISGRYVLAIRGPLGGLRNRRTGSIKAGKKQRISARVSNGATCRISVTRGQQTLTWSARG